MINVTELRPGNYFTEEGNLYNVIEILLNKTAMRKMVAKLKVKNVRTGSTTELSYNSGYAIERINIDKKKMQYLYDTGDALVFMDNVSYEQIEIQKNLLEWELNFLVVNSEVEIAMYEDEVLGLTLPAKMVLKITECAPGAKGNTVTNATKDAIVETGLRLRVPLFIEEGESVTVRTDNGAYDGRAKEE
ncbi:MAG TPA: elongation factor P [Bacilli bacterium]|nr:elongation factor P [Bacilli bacterium]